MKRVFLIVLDGFGVGASPDANKFGDVGANTLKTISKSEHLHIPNLLNLGLSSIDGVDYLPKKKPILAKVAKCRELSNGKDSVIGHWEISGLISRKPLPVYPNGFPDEIIKEFENKTGRKVICNKPYSGTEVIKDYGEEHIKSGSLIVYTSADSVFQIAAHEDVVSIEQLYEYCEIARDILVGDNAVGRVIARPFSGKFPFVRTKNRKDFSLNPPSNTMLDYIKAHGLDVISVGKIEDIFAGKGITEKHHTTSNDEGMKITKELLNKDFNGLCFVNLVDFDMLYGHRRDIEGYAKALSEFDNWLGNFIKNLKDDDLLIITADHGNDPGFTKTTDHTRELVPLIIYRNNITPCNLGTLNGFSRISAMVCNYLLVNK